MGGRLIVVRHANTFDKGDVVTRVGRATDLPLSTSGRLQAIRLGQHLSGEIGTIHQAFTGTLRRTQETMALICQQFPHCPEISVDPAFNEIDYGPDENRPEQDVVARIGREALDAWDTECIPPPGWRVDPEGRRQTWREFLRSLEPRGSATAATAVVVTSNGIARFLPAVLSEQGTIDRPSIAKMSTAAYSVLRLEGSRWRIEKWNERP